MAQKNMWIAMIISFIFTGLGIAYAGNVQKGVGLFAAAILCNILGMKVSVILSIISIVIWIYGLYATYQEVKLVNGE